jgi:hypothetical protein
MVLFATPVAPRNTADGSSDRTRTEFSAHTRYPNLLAVVDHYDSCFNLGLSSGQKADLVQFLKSR